jgi:hypothetical protein
MATDKRIGTKGSQAFSKGTIPGDVYDAGPYIGIIKNNVDPTRSGRLQVFIQGMGGVENEPSHWRTVRYASPFFGMTAAPRSNESKDQWQKTRHTYGMWFTPPDLENLVLVTFVQGKPELGYWFACINPTLSHSMVPGMAGHYTSKPNLSSDLTEALPSNTYPTVEFNEYNPVNAANWEAFMQNDKAVHEPQTKILLEQGLEEDGIRGVTTSSSQRESPSQVFGISTPGRDADDIDPATNAPKYRLGGHTFVMDDGDAKDNNRMIRLRTAGGHQIMMNDSEEIMYIANSTGSTWIEFTSEGKINMFAGSDFTLRSAGSINMHADKSINMFAGDAVNILAGNTIKEQTKTHTIKASTELKAYGGKIGIVSGSTLDLQAGSIGSFGASSDLIFGASMIYLNDKAPNPVENPADIATKSYPEASKVGKKWKANKTLTSITTTTAPPHHEPWAHNAIATPSGVVTKTGSAATSTIAASSPGAAAAVASSSSSAPSSAGAAGATGKGVSKPAPSSTLANQPAAGGTVGNMTKEETTALMAQIGYSESRGDYTAVNQLGYIGKYQFGAAALIDRGYVKAGTTNSGLNNPANWLNKDGIGSKDAFLGAPDVQEAVMLKNMQANYKTLSSKGAITSSSDSSQVAGLISVSHLLGAGGANSWSNGKGGSDANGTTGDTYYNRGRYAVTVLAKKDSGSTMA